MSEQSVIIDFNEENSTRNSEQIEAIFERSTESCMVYLSEVKRLIISSIMDLDDAGATDDDMIKFIMTVRDGIMDLFELNDANDELVDDMMEVINDDNLIKHMKKES